MKIKDLPKNSKPREKFLKYGKENLSDPELMAIILRTGSQKENVLDMSNKLLKEYSLEELFDCSLKELQKIKGIGENKAMQILAISELSKRYNLNKNKIIKISSAKDVYNYFKRKLEKEKQENFYILILNGQNNLIREQLITKGILDLTLIHPREVFKPAIKDSASKIILAHNHPSGDPSPSKEDLETTEILIASGEILGIKIIDHVIIGEEKYWSWKEN